MGLRALIDEPDPHPPGEAYPFEIDPDDAAARLARAIRIPTVSRPPPAPPWDSTALLAFHRFLEVSFPGVYRELDVATVSGFSLFFSWRGSAPELRPILLSAHMDVVPAPSEGGSEWAHPPFAGVIAGGYVWGRGALDNKGPLMAVLESIEGLIAAGYRPRRTVLVALGHDEEVGGLSGARAIAARLEDRGIQPLWSLDEGLAIVEGMIPGLDAPAALVGTQEKGYLTLRLVARGPGGHSSAPGDRTAIRTLAEAIRRLESTAGPIRLEGATRELFATLGPSLSLPLRLVAGNLWLFGWPAARVLARHPDLAGLVRTTAAVTVIEAGRVENRIPPTAEALVNFRIAPWETPSDVREQAARALQGLDVALEARAGPRPIPPSRRSSSDAEGFSLIRSAILRSFPDVGTVAPALVPAATDARHYEDRVDNVYRFAPFRADSTTFDRIHGIDERISVEEHAQMVRFYAELIRRSTE